MLVAVRAWRLAAGVAFVVSGAACSLLTSTDGLVGTDGDAAAPTPDAPSGMDAATDAGGSDASDASAASFCAPFLSSAAPPALCDDFERDSGVQGAWTSLQAKAPGTLTLVTEANNTFLRAATSGTGGEAGQLALHFAVPTEQTTFSISYRMRVSDTFDDGTYAELASVGLPRGDLDYRAIYLTFGRSYAGLTYNVVPSDGGGANASADFTFTRGAWQTTTISVDLKAASAKVFIGKNAVATANLPAALFGSSALDLSVGLTYGQESTGTLPVLNADFDDVTISYPATAPRP
jgi:hypothetical protein